MLFNEQKTFGFCPMCMQNVEHTRKFSSLLLNIADLLTLRILKLLRIGPWYCYQCEGKKFFLRGIRRDFPSFNRHNSQVTFDHASASTEPIVDQPTQESVGNYLRDGQSLLMREQRATRYSQKYRDSTVSRVLSEPASLQRISQELNVSTSDVVDWISDYVDRQQQTIRDLQRRLRSFDRNLKAEEGMMESSSDIVFNENGDQVIDGRTLP